MRRMVLTMVSLVLLLAVATPAVAQVEDANVTLQLASVTYVSPHEVLVTGTLTCDQPLSGTLVIVLTGRVHSGTVVPQPQTQVEGFDCSGETAFAVLVHSLRGLKFHVGQLLNVQADFGYCPSEFFCTGASTNANLKVQR
ncbi:MAG: hypothetical protein LC808_09040 [Actinobacteria bacterium]|nr:hypothetical protein [Actinomycetota bacterium]